MKSHRSRKAAGRQAGFLSRRLLAQHFISGAISNHQKSIFIYYWSPSPFYNSQKSSKSWNSIIEMIEPNEKRRIISNLLLAKPFPMMMFWQRCWIKEECYKEVLCWIVLTPRFFLTIIVIFKVHWCQKQQITYACMQLVQKGPAANLKIHRITLLVLQVIMYSYLIYFCKPRIVVVSTTTLKVPRWFE